MQNTIDWRELLGTLAHRGWRPYLGWGVSTGLIAIVFAIAWRLFEGTLDLASLVALAGALVPVVQYIQLRGSSSPPPPPPPPPENSPWNGGLVNNAAM